MHKQEEAGKKKSLNCGLGKKNVSQEVYSGWIMGAGKMSLRAPWVVPVLEKVRGTSQTKGGDDVAARETKDTHQNFNNIACSVILS